MRGRSAAHLLQARMWKIRDESMAQVGVKGRRDGRSRVKQGGTAGFPVPSGMEIRRFLVLDGAYAALEQEENMADKKMVEEITSMEVDFAQ